MKSFEFISESNARPEIEIRWDGNFSVHAYINNQHAGTVEFASDDPDGNGGFYAIDASVAPEFRRMGVATAMYDSAEERLGELIPSEHQTADAKAFWKARNGY
jgi:ribosomal protein S18 acetylase RimI-like enzyme